MSLFQQLASSPDWETRYAMLIEAGKHMEPLSIDLRTPTNRVHSCLSPTWLHLQENQGRVNLQGYSKSHIILGLIALLQEYISTKSLEELRGLSYEDFNPLQLSELITPTRQHGFGSMVLTIQSFAQRSL